MFHARTKQIEVHYHFVRERVLSGEVELRYVQTDRQVANIFNKALGSDKLQHFSEMLGVQRLDVPHLRGGTETSTDTEEAQGRMRQRQMKRKREQSRLKKSARPVDRSVDSDLDLRRQYQ